MSKQHSKNDPKNDSRGPVARGSTLYRMMELIAVGIALKLLGNSSDPASADQGHRRRRIVENKRDQ